MNEYSKNPIVDGLEHIGHFFHVAEHDTVGTAIAVIRRGIIVTDDLKSQLPTLATETAAVAGDVLKCKALMAAITLASAGEGLNLAADAGVLAALVTDGPALVELVSNAVQLVKTAGVDIKTDVEAIDGH